MYETGKIQVPNPAEGQRRSFSRSEVYTIYKMDKQQEPSCIAQGAYSEYLVITTGRPGVLQFMGSQRVGHD